jgi:predicted metal-dependent phosphoesterase TrpH
VRIDLHAHSAVSDGTEPPATLIARAAVGGIDVLALTDHDTVAGWTEATAAAVEHGVRLVPGIELSTEHAGADVHLLAFWPDPAAPELAATLAALVDARERRAEQIVARLAEHGVQLSTDDVRLGLPAGAPVGRPHVADALVRRGYAADRRDAFDRWLGEGRPGHVRKEAPSLVDGIRMIRAAGGVPVVAHPWGRGSRAVLDAPTVVQLAAEGLAGLEVDHADHDPQDRAALRRLAAGAGLLVTGGSDDHGPGGKVGVALGDEGTDPDVFDALAAQATGATAPR